MKFLLFITFASLTLSDTLCHATSPFPSQLYWNSVLPETPMPKALSELIQPDVIGSAQPFPNYEDYYGDHGPGNTLLEDPKQVMFFFEKNINPGTTMKLSLARNTTASTFLSKKFSEAIPFSSGKLPQLLNKFRVQPGSSEANVMKNTIETCERKAFRGEDRRCVTSLESMIDFATSKLGRRNNIRVVSTEVESRATLHDYTIIPGVKKLADSDEDKFIVCHRLGYGYAVFNCHTFAHTMVYVLPLQGSDKTKAKALAICHKDTSQWKPSVLLRLKVKPGTVPVCHFIREGDIAWVSNQKHT